MVRLAARQLLQRSQAVLSVIDRLDLVHDPQGRSARLPQVVAGIKEFRTGKLREFCDVVTSPCLTILRMRARDGAAPEMNGNPWEGWSDTYRETVRHGGIPETWFWPYLAARWGHSTTRVEDLSGENARASVLRRPLGLEGRGIFRHQGAGICCGKLDRSGHAHARDARGFQENRLAAKMARGSWPEKVGLVLRSRKRPAAAGVFRLLSEGHPDVRPTMAQVASRGAREILRRRDEDRERVAKRPAHARGDKHRERLDIHVDAGAVERRQIGIAVSDADDGPRITT